MRRVAAVLLALYVCVLCFCGLFGPAYAKVVESGRRSRCSNDERQLALAALVYADDKRSFPHARAADALDGDVSTSDGPRAIASLVRLGYHTAGSLTCPSTPDEAPPHPGVTGRPAAEWSYSGRPGDAVPSLAETTALSYGWTRRALPALARSSTPLLADRAVRANMAVTRAAGDDPLQGNHADGLFVATADGTVNWSCPGQEDAARLVATEARGDGALGIADPARPLPPPARRWTEVWPALPALALLAGALAPRRRARLDPEAP